MAKKPAKGKKPGNMPPWLKPGGKPGKGKAPKKGMK